MVQSTIRKLFFLTHFFLFYSCVPNPMGSLNPIFKKNNYYELILQAAPDSKNYGVVTGLTGATQVFTFSNQGFNNAANCTTPVLSGVNATDFTLQNNTCGSSLEVGASCTVEVFPSPQTAQGLKSATLTKICYDQKLLVPVIREVPLSYMSPNLPPSISAGSSVTINRSTATTQNFTISDSETTLACNSTYISATSNNQELITNASLTFSGTIGACALAISPIALKYGQATITVTVTDGTNTTTTTIPLTVNYTLNSTGLGMWLKADTGVTTDAFGVTQWADQSGNNRNFVQAVDAKKPQYVASSIGSKPALVFDGSNDFLTGNSSTVQTAIVVGASTGLNGQAIQQMLAGSSSTWYMTTYFDGSNLFSIHLDGSWRNYSESIAFNTPVIHTVTFNSKLMSGRINGKQLGWNLSNSNYTTGPVTYIGTIDGSDRMWKGPISEVIIYNRELSQSEIHELESYLANKYSIELNLGTKSIWYKADAITGATNAQALPAGWSDSSANARTLTVNEGAPIYKQYGLNAKATVGFDGVSSLTTASFALDPTATTYVIAKYDGGDLATDFTGSGAILVNHGLGGNWQFLSMRHGAYNGVYARTENGSIVDTYPETSYVTMVNSGAWMMAGSKFDNLTKQKLTVNGTDSFSANASRTVAGSQPLNVASFPSFNCSAVPCLKGEIAEILSLNSSITLEKMKLTESYFSHKYNLNVNSNSILNLYGLELWLKADEGVEHTANAVSAWRDQSGKGRDVTQSTAALQPTYVESSSINSKPSVSFNTSDTDEVLMGTTPLLSTNSDYTIFAVVRPTSTGAGSIWSTYGLANSTGFEFYHSNVLMTWGGAGGSSFTGSTNISTSTNYLLGCVKSGTTFTGYLNGTSDGTTTFANSLGALSNMAVGNGTDYTSEAFNGDIAEILIFSRGLSPSERQTVECYLSNKYALGIGGC